MDYPSDPNKIEYNEQSALYNHPMQPPLENFPTHFPPTAGYYNPYYPVAAPTNMAPGLAEHDQHYYQYPNQHTNHHQWNEYGYANGVNHNQALAQDNTHQPYLQHVGEIPHRIASQGHERQVLEYRDHYMAGAMQQSSREQNASTHKRKSYQQNRNLRHAAGKANADRNKLEEAAGFNSSSAHKGASVLKQEQNQSITASTEPEPPPEKSKVVVQEKFYGRHKVSYKTNTSKTDIAPSTDLQKGGAKLKRYPKHSRSVLSGAEKNVAESKDSHSQAKNQGQLKENNGLHTESGVEKRLIASDKKEGSYGTNRYRYRNTSRYNRSKLGEQDQETQRGALIEQLSSDCYECMVCCEIVKSRAAVWSCSGCYHVFHLHCARKWARTSNATIEDSTGWRCPACQKVHQDVPNSYKCFCGKVTDPIVNRFEIPHSCGEVCSKVKPNDCIHKCNILCHPGPCPPCLASISKTCLCKRSSKTVRCGQAIAVQCDQPCRRTLNCGRHECQQECHIAPCSPCEEVIKQSCYCGADNREVVCGSSKSYEMTYSCKQVCGRMLDCGKHKCQQLCHPGTCDSCELSPSRVTRCPCEATSLEALTDDTRQSCTDPVPCCSNICGRKLKCGPLASPHRCKLVCHEGECEPCDGESPVTCRCGSIVRELACSEMIQYTDENPFLCDKRCKKKRDCGRHKCGQVCCVDDVHKCTKICGRPLSCKLHRCEEPCHRNNCHTCWHVSFDELECHCGAQVLYPPIPCGTKPPECQAKCTRTHPCQHPVYHNCHSEEDCPPCPVLTEKMCVGGHELRKNIPCYQTNISCGMPCNKPLPCGMHNCQTTCHKGDCLSEHESCTQPCVLTRTQCTHPCAQPCHQDQPCPAVPCQAKIQLQCKCGNRTETVQCMMGGGDVSQHPEKQYKTMVSMMMAVKMTDIQAGQSFDISDLNVTDNKKRPRMLECSNECLLLERNKRLAEALKIENPDLNSKVGAVTYTAFIKDYFKQHPSFCLKVEDALITLVTKARESLRPKRSHAFSSMSQAQRRFVHELSECFLIETQSFDQEPNKNVVATAIRDKSILPTTKLSSTIRQPMMPVLSSTKAHTRNPWGTQGATVPTSNNNHTSTAAASYTDNHRTTTTTASDSWSSKAAATTVTPASRSTTTTGATANSAASGGITATGGSKSSYGGASSLYYTSPTGSMVPLTKSSTATSNSSKSGKSKSQPVIDYFNMTD